MHIFRLVKRLTVCFSVLFLKSLFGFSDLYADWLNYVNQQGLKILAMIYLHEITIHDF